MATDGVAKLRIFLGGLRPYHPPEAQAASAGRGLRAEAQEAMAMWSTAAGIGMLVTMLLGAVLIGYCLQVGRRKNNLERQRNFDAKDVGGAQQCEKQAEAPALSPARPGSPSRPGTAWSARNRPLTAPERSGAGRPTSASSGTFVEEHGQGIPRSRQARAVLESQIMDSDEFEWARPATDILSARLPEGRFTVEDLCTVYLDRPRPFTSPEAPRKPIRMEDLRDATAAAILAAEEKEKLSSVHKTGNLKHARSHRRQDVPHKEVWANSVQSPVFFEVSWRPPPLVKEWELPRPTTPSSTLPSRAGRKPRLKRSWTVSSEQWLPGPGLAGEEPAPPPDLTPSTWLSDKGEFLRPAPLKARVREPPPSPPPPVPVTFQQRAATAAAWVLGRRRDEPKTSESQEDPEAQADLLVNEMREQLQHTRKEPLQVRKLIFRDLQRQLHPDKNTECEEAAKFAFQKLMEERRAYLGPEPVNVVQAK
mmetsp:Transcript_30326/g.67971  ORF Transcript_30326/g.67971 Transcript_30326/m.67971 type:complete len:478 (+) Transcript_30326:64-1497(+)